MSSVYFQQNAYTVVQYVKINISAGSQAGTHIENIAR